MGACLAVDPGITTGLAFRIGDDIQTLAVRVDEYTPITEVYDIVVAYQYDWICVEQFQTANVISRYGLRTAELVGAIEALAWVRKIKCYRRTAQHRLPCMNEAQIYLKDHRVQDHQVDALAHLFAMEAAIKRGKV